VSQLFAEIGVPAGGPPPLVPGADRRDEPYVAQAAAPRPSGRTSPRSRAGRSLKHRVGNETRTIPIPRSWSWSWSWSDCSAHIKRFGTTLDGRVFQTARGGILQDSGYNEVWDEARREALTPAQYRSPLGRRPYDLRHAAVSLWLNSGVPATGVARHAGHGAAVLLKMYTHCIDGQATAANKRIAEALVIQDAEEDLGDEGDGDTEQAS
jgi:integrase